MIGMTLEELKETMTTHDEIEFSYRGMPYDFQKDPAEGSQIKISISIVEGEDDIDVEFFT